MGERKMRINARDENGMDYQSLAEMYRKRGVDVTYSAFLKRLDAGWSIEECLNGKVRKGKRISYKNVLYQSIKQFCEIQQINVSQFKTMLRRFGSVQGLMEHVIRERKEKNGGIDNAKK